MARLLSLALSWQVVTQRGVDGVRASVALSGEGANESRNSISNMAVRADEAVDALSVRLVDSAHHHVEGVVGVNLTDGGQIFVEPEDLTKSEELATDVVHRALQSSGFESQSNAFLQSSGSPLSGFESDLTPISQWKALKVLLDIDDDIQKGGLLDDTANSELQSADQLVHNSVGEEVMTTHELVRHIITELLLGAHTLTEEEQGELSADFHVVEKKMGGHMDGVETQWAALRKEIVIDDDVHAVATALSDSTGIASAEVGSNPGTSIEGTTDYFMKSAQLGGSLESIASDLRSISKEVKTVDGKAGVALVSKGAKAAEKAAEEAAEEKAEKAAEEKAEEAAEKPEEAAEKVAKAAVDEKGEKGH